MASQPQNGAQPRFLGRYELMYLLGQGGMGEVHLARLTGAAGFEKLCIVKTILPQMMTDPQFVDRFHHEAKVLTHLTHSNIAQVYDMGDVDETLYMAIEYVAGVDLSRVEDRVKGMHAMVPVQIAVLIGQQITEALGYAHRKVGADGAALGIVHRDVSPQNVMVSYEGEVKVIDFGLAKSTARSKHTMPSTVLGKLGYMSPEQAKGEPVDHRSDIYSAGIVLWELIAGRPLFLGGTVGEMVAQMAFPKVVSLRSIRPEVSETLDRTVMRALAADPSARYNRADDFSRALNELLVRENLSVSSEDVGNYVRSMCPEEFAAERNLQSKLSSDRKKGSSPKVQSRPAEYAGTAIRQSSRDLDAVADTGKSERIKLEGTMLRPPAAVQPLTGPQRALSGSLSPAPRPLQLDRPVTPRPATPAPMRPPSSPMQQPRESFVGVDATEDELKIQKSNGPLIAVLAVALLALAGGGYLYTQRGGDAVVVEPPKTEEPKELIVAKPEEEKLEAVEVKPEDKPAEEKIETPTKTPELIAAPLTRTEVQGETLAMFRDKGELWVRPSKKTKLKIGDELTVVGGPIAGTAMRETYGAGAIMELKGPIGRVDEGVQVPKGLPMFAVIDKGGRKKAERVAAAAAITPAPAKTPEPAITPRPFPGDAKPAEKKEELPAAVAAPVKKEALVLKGRITNESSRGVMLFNDSTFNWTNCEVRLPFKKVFRFEDVIAANNSDNIRHRNFAEDTREPDQHMKAGWAMVRCKEAGGYLWWGPKMALE